MAEMFAALVLALSPAHHHGHYPAYWRREASCIRYQESRGEWHLRDGAYQIIPPTWASGLRGWTGRPLHWASPAGAASPARQTFVAWRIWVHNGRSWGANGQWPSSARACGVR